MIWVSTILTAIGTSILTCAFMEAYYQRRASEKIYDHDILN